MKTTENRQWALLATVGAALLLIALDNTVLYTALPVLIRELGATQSQGLWIINAYPLVMAGLLLGAGTLGDRIGHRQMFLGGLLLFGIASLFAAFAPSANLLILARALLAVGAAAMMPATLALIFLTFEDERERNVAIAVWGSLALVGAALGPIIGGLLLEHFWWGSVFLINVPVVLLALAAGVVLTPHCVPDRSKPWDLVSSLLALVTLSGLVFSIKLVSQVQPQWLQVAAALALTLLAGTLFTRRQLRLRYPLLDFGIFRNPAFGSGALAAALVTFAIGGVQLVTTQRFQLVAGFSPLEAGLLVSAIAVGCLPSALLGGAYLHRVGLLVLISGGLFVSMLGICLAAFGLHGGFAWLVAGMLVTGLGLGSVIAVASSAIMGSAPAHRAGMASSVEEVSYEFGSLFAVSLLGSLLSALYSARMTVPEGAPAAVRESIIQALDIARDNPAGDTIVRAAHLAYDQSYLDVMYVIAFLLALGTLATAVMLRHHRPGMAAPGCAAH